MYLQTEWVVDQVVVDQVAISPAIQSTCKRMSQEMGFQIKIWNLVLIGIIASRCTR